MNTLTYLALVLVVGVLFWLSRQRQNKNRQPWLAKLVGRISSEGALTGPGKLQASVSASSDVAAVLEDIYQEFHLEVERLETEMQRLATELSRATDERWLMLGEEMARLRNQVEKLQSPDRPAELLELPHRSPTKDTGAHYFAILDELVRGHEPIEICRRLGVGLEQVEIVQRLMSHPSNPPQ